MTNLRTDKAFSTQAAEQGAGEWQPIETAPKDGTAVLLASQHLIGVGYWFSTFEWSRLRFKRAWQLVWGEGNADKSVTHWMPLPDLPHPAPCPSTEERSGEVGGSSPKTGEAT